LQQLPSPTQHLHLLHPAQLSLASSVPTSHDKAGGLRHLAELQDKKVLEEYLNLFDAKILHVPKTKRATMK
jgi:hypothetical protein